MRRQKKAAKAKRQIAPRLLSGERRLVFGHGLPQEIKEAAFLLAAEEGISAGWWAEQLFARAISHRLGVKAPRIQYKRRRR